MRKFFFLSVLLSFFLFPSHAFAHLAGQPSFFKMNGTFTNLYPVQSASLTDLDLPQDASPTNYIVNTSIDLEMDTSRMMIPQDIIQQTKFQWDFGDGTKGEGLHNPHTYKKPGSYILSIYALSPDLPTPQLIQSVMINVLPNKDYKLPKSIIQINGDRSKNPVSDILQEPFLEPVTYDGSLSQNGTAKIASYFWDLGDEKSGNTMIFTHSLPNQYYMAFPILRVKDANGFISDSYVQVNNDSHNGKIPPSKKKSQTKSANINFIPMIGIGGLILVVIIGGVIFLATSRKNK